MKYANYLNKGAIKIVEKEVDYGTINIFDLFGCCSISRHNLHYPLAKDKNSQYSVINNCRYPYRKYLL